MCSNSENVINILCEYSDSTEHMYTVLVVELLYIWNMGHMINSLVF